MKLLLDTSVSMATQEHSEEVLWMADCYTLAKRFPNCRTWMALLEPLEPNQARKLTPFHYWLWMEIWQAAQPEPQEQAYCRKC